MLGKPKKQVSQKVKSVKPKCQLKDLVNHKNKANQKVWLNKKEQKQKRAEQK